SDKKVYRDLEKAREHRDRARYTVAAGDIAKQWMKSPEARQLKQFQRVNGVMQKFFSPEILAQIKPLRLAKGCLTIGAPDSVLLSELRNHYNYQFHEALINAGTGVKKIIYRRI
ncbi:MAG: DUF721 domain-containing protein, partial [Planctomycetes bacterium]|nr:DUF721 domain-containing protein [Planctomycetota bacterium]